MRDKLIDIHTEDFYLTSPFLLIASAYVYAVSYVYGVVFIIVITLPPFIFNSNFSSSYMVGPHYS